MMPSKASKLPGTYHLLVPVEGEAEAEEAATEEEAEVAEEAATVANQATSTTPVTQTSTLQARLGVL